MSDARPDPAFTGRRRSPRGLRGFDRSRSHVGRKIAETIDPLKAPIARLKEPLHPIALAVHNDAGTSVPIQRSNQGNRDIIHGVGRPFSFSESKIASYVNRSDAGG